MTNLNWWLSVTLFRMMYRSPQFTKYPKLFDPRLNKKLKFDSRFPQPQRELLKPMFFSSSLTKNRPIKKTLKNKEAVWLRDKNLFESRFCVMSSFYLWWGVP